MDKNNINDIVNDLLKFLLCKFKEKEMSISHYRIQKTIFKIKKELGQTHPLINFYHIIGMNMVLFQMLLQINLKY